MCSEQAVKVSADELNQSVVDQSKSDKSQVARTSINLQASWLEPLRGEFDQPYMQKLKAFLKAEKQRGAVLYPAGKEIFNALNTTPLDQVSVVILGQDPYHGPGQAHGLCFSVQPRVTAPPSLVNIFKELEQDLGVRNGEHGCLLSWAQQGVLLLNSVLTVERGRAGSHQGKGWERFTDRVVSVLNERCSNLVFMLWGSYAHKKGAVIDGNKHLVLKSTHPSPLSAHRGFLGCRHFSQANAFLSKVGKMPINWALPPLS